MSKFRRLSDSQYEQLVESLQKNPSDSVRIHGFFRLQVEEDGKIVGDSGWNQNVVTNDGFNQYLCMVMAASAGSKLVGYMALGTGSQPGATDTTLDGELAEGVREAVTAATSSSSKTVRFTATFASGDSFVTASRNISNVGLFQTDSGTTIFAGNTYASSAVATNQNVNATYDTIFS